jgi:hypothetical protein
MLLLQVKEKPWGQLARVRPDKQQGLYSAFIFTSNDKK